MVGVATFSTDRTPVSCRGQPPRIGAVPVGRFALLLTLFALIVPMPALAANWSAQRLPAPSGAVSSSGLSAVSCTSPSACTAIGLRDDRSLGSVPLVEAWDGRRWRVQDSARPSGMFNVLGGVSCTSKSECIAVGSFGDGRFTSGGFAERWDGRHWSLQATPQSTDVFTAYALSDVSCSSASACTAVGSTYIGVGPGGLPVAERWDGRGWTLQSTPAPAGAAFTSLSGVSCTSASACTAVGDSSAGGGAPELTLAERWDGTSWALQETPNPVSSIQSLSAVSCTSPSACSAVGSYSTPGGDRTLAERWDGTHWTIQPTPNPAGATNDDLNGVSCTSASRCIAVGFHGDSGSGGPLVEAWDGSRWTIQRTPSVANGGLRGVSCTLVIVCTAVGGDSQAPLVERSPPPGSATLARIRARCVRAPFRARVAGHEIASVNWYMDGRRLRGHTVHRGTRYAALIRIAPGKHHLKVVVKFDVLSGHPAETLRRKVSGCKVHRV
jgi:hypothetical protein